MQVFLDALASLGLGPVRYMFEEPRIKVSIMQLCPYSGKHWLEIPPHLQQIVFWHRCEAFWSCVVLLSAFAINLTCTYTGFGILPPRSPLAVSFRFSSANAYGLKVLGKIKIHWYHVHCTCTYVKTSKVLQVLSSVTLNCQVTMIWIWVLNCLKCQQCCKPC